MNEEVLAATVRITEGNFCLLSQMAGLWKSMPSLR